MIAGTPFMKLKLIAALVAIPAVAYAQQGQSNVPKPTKGGCSKRRPDRHRRQSENASLLPT